MPTLSDLLATLGQFKGITRKKALRELLLIIGETDESIIEGAEKVARIGVIPYLLPLRPISGTTFENQSPPKPKRMLTLYQKIAEILHKSELDPSRNKAGCVKCGACSALSEAFAPPP
jgi:biotin synthase-related radical SAM superfamily protein